MVVILGVDDCPKYDEVEVDLTEFIFLYFIFQLLFQLLVFLLMFGDGRKVQ